MQLRRISIQLLENAELNSAQASGLGLHLGSVCISAIGAADDCALISPSLLALQSLLNLSSKISQKSLMTLVEDKTKLLVYSPKIDISSQYWLETQPLQLNGYTIPPSKATEHIGVMCSNSLSNLPAIQSRISAHTKAMSPILACGAARRHFASPAATI